MSCRDCTRFVNEPKQIEAMLPGLAVLGSARASVRGDDGICTEHDRVVSADDECEKFQARIKSDRDRP